MTDPNTTDGFDAEHFNELVAAFEAEPDPAERSKKRAEVTAYQMKFQGGHNALTDLSGEEPAAAP